MAARRNKRGRQRRRGRFGFLYKVLSVGLILAAILVGCIVFFRVDRIEVAGQGRYTAEQIIAAAEVERGDNLFLLDRIKKSNQVRTRLPYVAEVSITKMLPDTLVITVSECEAVAAVQAEGAWWLLNSSGKYVERTDADGAAGLPEVTGLAPVAPMVGTKLDVAEEDAVKLTGLRKLFKALEGRGMLGGVENFDFSAANTILMGYGGRFTVKMHMSSETDFDRETRILQGAGERLPASSTGVLDLTLEGDAHLIPYS